MSEPVRISDATLYLGDCLEILPTLGPVDAVVTDPPYGINYAEWDKHGVAQEVIRICRNMSPSVVVHCGQSELWHYAEADWVMAWFMPFSYMRTKQGKIRHWEPILVYGEMKPAIDAYAMNPAKYDVMGHPCLKPTELEEWLIGGFSDDGNTILDPFMGSGTTGVACARLGRRFIGIEIEPRYFEIACKRIKREYEQLKLFPSEPKREAVQLDLEAME